MRSVIYNLTIQLLLSFSCVACSQGLSGQQFAYSDEGNPTDSTETTQTIRLLFAGDLMQHQAQIDAARQGDTYVYDSYFERVKDRIKEADVAVGNLEVTLGGKPYKGYPCFSAPDEYLTAIQEAGFDVLLTANNHCLDRRKKGLERTIQLLDEKGTLHAGTYTNQEERAQQYPLLIEKNGFRIVLLNYTYGTNGIPVNEPNIVNFIQKEVMEQDITEAHAMNPDVIIACMHWGDEYQLLPNNQQSKLANWLFAQGVDHIIGSHPHVVQPAEVRTDSVTGQKHLLVYSLGNFISNMSKRNTDGGMMVELDLQKDSICTLKDCRYALVWTGRPVITGKKNLILYPADTPADEMNEASRQRMRLFLNDSRKLFEKHNKGIDEFFFQKTE